MGGQATAFVGGVELDLRDAAVMERPATIDVTVVMGGAEIRVPPEWTVRLDALAIMGGASDSRKKKGAVADRTSDLVPDDSPHLVITGLVLMGGVEIKG